MRNEVGATLVALIIVGLGAAAVGSQPQRPGQDRPPPRGEGGSDRPGDRPPHPLMQALDTDGDGVLSPEEIKNASRSLMKLDKNGDGKLSPDELRPAGGPGRRPGGPGRGGQGGPPPDRRGGGGPPGGGPPPGRDGGPPPERGGGGGPPPAAEQAQTTGEGIQWFATWQQGLAAAKSTGKPILFVMAATSCGGVPGIW